MSSPTPDITSRKAEVARARAVRSQLITRGALLVGLALLLGLIGQSFLHTASVKAIKETLPPAKPQSIVSELSSFSGIDQNNQPFSVKASKGMQDPNIETLIHLETIVGSFVRREGGVVKITANQAAYEIKNKDLQVSGNVRFEEPGRYVAHLKSASVNLDKQIIVTKEPVQVETSNASVSADSMETSDDGKVVTLRGSVKAHFETDAAP